MSDELRGNKSHRTAQQPHIVVHADAIKEQGGHHDGDGGQANADTVLVDHDLRDYLRHVSIVDTELVLIANKSNLIQVKDKERDGVEDREDAHKKGKTSRH